MRRRPVRRGVARSPWSWPAWPLTLSGVPRTTPSRTTLNPQGHYGPDHRQPHPSRCSPSPVWCFVIVVGGTLLIAAKYRVPCDADHDEDMPAADPRQLQARGGLDHPPALILLVVGIATVVAMFDLAKVPPPQGPSASRWSASSGGGSSATTSTTTASTTTIITANELVIPERHRQSRCASTSHDVIHSFWIPALNGKQRRRAGPHPAVQHRGRPRPASTSASAPSSAASPTPTCA